MFGGYRCVLALMVCLSHYGLQFSGFNPGQWAVISFYVLSGLLMERQFNKITQGGKPITLFYLDRFLRIYPMYLIVMLLAASLVQLSHFEFIANVLLLPLDYTNFFKCHIVIGPAWSLACEMHFYLLVPLLCVSSTRLIKMIFAASLVLFTVSPLLPHVDFWAYGGSLGIFFVFLTGILINRRETAFLRAATLFMFCLFIAFSLTKICKLHLPTGININVCIGYLLAAGIVPVLEKISNKNPWDKAAGWLALPIFLSHEFVAAFLGRYFHVQNILVWVAGTILFTGLIVIVVELPIDRFRYRLRRERTPLQTAGAIEPI